MTGFRKADTEVSILRVPSMGFVHWILMMAEMLFRRIISTYCKFKSQKSKATVRLRNYITVT